MVRAVVLMFVFAGAGLFVSSASGPNEKEVACRSAEPERGRGETLLLGSGGDDPCDNECARIRPRTEPIVRNSYAIPCCKYLMGDVCCQGRFREVDVVYPCEPVQNPCAAEDGCPLTCVTDDPQGCRWAQLITWEEYDCRSCCDPDDCIWVGEAHYHCAECREEECAPALPCYQRVRKQYWEAPTRCPVCNLVCDCNEPPCMLVPKICEEAPGYRRRCLD